MVQVLQAQSVTLRDLIDHFGLEFVQDDQFFVEWKQDLPELTNLEQQFLDRVKAGYFNLITDPPVLEKPVQFAIVSPLLFVASFYLPPFQIKAEQSVELVEQDEDVLIRGSLDILILKERLWLLVIESERVSFSTEAGLPQILSYLLSNSNRKRPAYGLITNGASFLFVKLVWNQVPQYTISDEFHIKNSGNDLYRVLQIIKGLGD